MSRKKFSFLKNIFIAFLLSSFFLCHLQGREVSKEREELTTAIRKGDVKLVKSLFKTYSIPTDEVSKYSETPLMEAVEKGDLNCIEYLIKNGADVNFYLDDKTPINFVFKNYSAKNDSLALSVIELLFISGAEINIPCYSFRSTPFMEACKNNAKQCVDFFISHEVNLEFQDYEGKTALMFSAENRNKEAISILIDLGVDVNIQDKRGKTSLIYAIKSENIETVNLLIKAGADVNACDFEGTYPFMYALESDAPPIKELFLNIAADLTVTNNQGQSALFFLAKSNDIKSADFLIKKGVSVDRQDNEGYTPFLKAAEAHQKKMYQFLLECGADPLVSNYKNQSALFFLAKSNDTKSADFLIKKGLFIDQKDDEGYTPILKAIEDGQTQMVKFLIECEADLNVKTYSGKTPIFLCAANNNIESFKILIDKKILFDEPEDSFGITPLMAAIIIDNSYMVSKLLKAGAKTNAGIKSKCILKISPYQWSIEAPSYWPKFPLFREKSFDIPTNTTPKDLAKILDRKSILDIFEKS